MDQDGGGGSRAQVQKAVWKRPGFLPLKQKSKKKKMESVV